MKCEKGLTLLEIIIVLVITSIILIFTTSLITQTKAESEKQYKNSQILASNSFILKQITNDVRESIKIDETNNEIIFYKHDNSTTIYTYDQDENILKRNNQQLASNLKSFEIKVLNNSVSIQLENLRNELINTTVFLRGE